MTTQKAVKRLINSVWTIEYKQNALTPGEIEIVRYSRDDDEGYEKEHELPSGKLIEDDYRTVTGAVIGGVIYRVKNPRHIFSY